MRKGIALCICAALLLSGCGGKSAAPAECADPLFYNVIAFDGSSDASGEEDEGAVSGGLAEGMYAAAAPDLSDAQNDTTARKQEHDAVYREAAEPFSVTLTSVREEYAEQSVTAAGQRVEVESALFPEAAASVEAFWSHYAELPLEAAQDSPLDCDQWLCVTRLDGAVLSFRTYETRRYAGSDQMLTLYGGVSFDPATGEVLALEDVLDEGGYDGLMELLRRRAASTSESAGEEDTDTYLYAVEQDELDRQGTSFWYFTDVGVNFYLPAQPTVSLSYGELDGILAAEYLPGDREYAYGALYVSLDPEELPTREIVLDPDGVRYYVTSDAVLSDLRVELGSDVSGNYFLLRQLYAADCLPPDRQLCIVADPEHTDALRICYNGDLWISLGELFDNK